LRNKTVYLNVKYVIATRNCELFYRPTCIYATSHWKYHTFGRFYSCSSANL